MAAIVVAGDRYSGVLTTRGQTTSFGSDWTADHEDAVYGVSIDPSGNVATTGLRTSNITTRRYDSDGNEDWSVDFGDNTFCCASGNDGSVYVGGVSTSGSGNYSIKKYNSSGSLQLSLDHGGTVYGIAVDSNNNIYVAGDRVSNITTRKYNSSGTEQWSADHGDTVYCIDVDADGNVYTGGNPASNITTRKYNSSGTEQWNKDHGSTVYGIAVNSSGDVFTGGYYYSTDSCNIRKYNSSGTQQWIKLHGTGIAIFGVSVDTGGNSYFCGTSTGSLTARKYDSSGTQINTHNHGATARAIKWIGDPVYRHYPDSIPMQVNIGTCWFSQPSIPISLSLGLPTQHIIPPFPALPISIFLGIPTTQWILPPSAIQPTLIFRLYLTGGPGIIELPIQNIQALLYADTTIENSLSIVVPYAFLEDVNARSSGTLLLRYGVLLTYGNEQTIEWLRATLSSIRYDLGANSASLSLYGAISTTNIAPRTRTISRSFKRGHVNGLRYRICDIDPFLLPGDIVDFGDESFTVSKITLNVGNGIASMQISE